MSKNILISALGANKIIINETIGFVNYSKECDFYSNSPQRQHIMEMREKNCFSNNQADELWLIATNRPRGPKTSNIVSVEEDFECIKNECYRYVKHIRLFILKGVKDITNEKEALSFRDLTFRVVAYARSLTNNGKLYLSLACGRKTMSADFQEAAYCFGCNALLHILGDDVSSAYPLNLGNISKNEALEYDTPLFEDKEILYCEPSTAFLDNINQQKKQTQHFYTTYYLNENEARSNFHILYTLSPSKIEELKRDMLGCDIDSQQTELEYIKRLPKTDLHCHLGGVLSAREMIEVAKCYLPEIEKTRLNNTAFANWNCHYDGIEGLKAWYNRKANELGVHKSLIASSLILQYENKIEDLHELIFGDCAMEHKYKSIGIRQYERHGDLQGSALLSNIDAIRKTVQFLLKNCRDNNVDYIEIRCSPINYITENITGEDVLNTIFSALEEASDISSSVILIASRHGNPDNINKSISLVQKMKDNQLFKKYFRGFDLAGDEEAMSPKELREKFLEIMKDCYNITIHAGETAPSENIWQAVYYLTAERIGHGLKLEDNEELMEKFLERGIAIEMCPSSNFQIVGYQDAYYPETHSEAVYPLKKYLDKELKVSVNTDNPGISITNPTYELHRAARLTPGGLSKWDILQLICNGYKTAFFPYERKKILIRDAEKKIGNLVKDNLL